MRWRKTKKGEPSRWKLLLWTAVASLVFGLIGMGEAPEDALLSLPFGVEYADGRLMIADTGNSRIRSILLP